MTVPRFKAGAVAAAPRFRTRTEEIAAAFADEPPAVKIAYTMYSVAREGQRAVVNAMCLCHGIARRDANAAYRRMRAVLRSA